MIVIDDSPAGRSIDDVHYDDDDDDDDDGDGDGVADHSALQMHCETVTQTVT